VGAGGTRRGRVGFECGERMAVMAGPFVEL
jgi:hypothetical protein